MSPKGESSDGVGKRLSLERKGPRYNDSIHPEKYDYDLVGLIEMTLRVFRNNFSFSFTFSSFFFFSQPGHTRALQPLSCAYIQMDKQASKQAIYKRYHSKHQYKSHSESQHNKKQETKNKFTTTLNQEIKQSCFGGSAALRSPKRF